VADKRGLEDEASRMKKICATIIKRDEGVPKKAPVNIDALDPEQVGYKRKKGRGASKAPVKKTKRSR
jgi:hypothetical protein